MRKQEKNYYSKQIILVGEGQKEQAKPLVEKWKKQRPEAPCTVIEYHPRFPINSEHYKELAILDAQSRLVIMGHGNGDTENIYLYEDSFIAINFKDIAKILSYYVHPGDVIDGEQKLKISLIVCYGTSSPDNKPKNSLAGKLHRELRLKGLRVDLHARTTTVITESNGSKSTVIRGQEEKYNKRNALFNKKLVEASQSIKTYKNALQAKKETLKDSIEKKLNNLSSEVNILKSLRTHHQRSSKLIFRWDIEGKQKTNEAYMFKRFKKQMLFTEKNLAKQKKLQQQNEHNKHSNNDDNAPDNNQNNAPII